MICPECGTPMNHLNRGGGLMQPDKYQTYDYLECPHCYKMAIEFYHTEFIEPDKVGKIIALKVEPEWKKVF
jgi:DNA-directed RNA polymerase subunit RPC12/RpoP